ncbi:MAG: DUF4962 domain-containing protein, partial [Chitinispirillaceae bacterium]|nr:DUF4962 domain-containing protein [Chitinispirillaceae bacterium]
AIDPDPISQLTYRLMYSKNSNFSGGIDTGYNININSYTVEVGNELSDNTTYFWKVYVKDNTGFITMCSSTFTFFVDVTNDVPYSFSLLKPSNGVILNTRNPEFDWTDAYDPDPLDSVNYTLIISTSELLKNTTNISTKWRFENLTESKFVLSWSERLYENKKYYWKVLAKDTTGALSISDTYEFTIPIISVPLEPTGVKGRTESGVFILQWSPVLKNVDGSNMDDLLGYCIYKGNSIDSLLKTENYIFVSSNTS